MSDLEYDEVEENLRKAIMLLDCALPHFVIQAEAERRHNATTEDSVLRKVTCQKRLQAVRAMIRDVGPTVGYGEQ